MTPALFLTFGGVIVGSIFTGGWWRLGVLIGYFSVFFIVETRILCSHCPYYSREGLMLHCLANHGFIRFYKYHPEPMNTFERVLLIIGFILFGTLPLLAQVPSIVTVAGGTPFNKSVFITLVTLIGVSVLGVIFSFTFLFTRICTKCVNFSCPFNKVPKEIIDSYLDKNPIMKKAWINHGHNQSK